MWFKAPQLCPINSLMAKCIRQCCNNAQQKTHSDASYKCHLNDQTNHGNDIIIKKLSSSDNGILNINLRQSIIDYILRERVSVSAQFVCQLIDGGLYTFDLWSLTDHNNFTINDICMIVITLAKNMNSMYELTLGGSSWIYNTRVVKGPLRSIFSQKLPKLMCLKMQQIASSDDLLSIFESCDNLLKLDICQPSINDRDIDNIESQLNKCLSRKSVKELRLPSSLKANSILKLLTIFFNVQSLKCTHFEQLLELIDSIELKDNNHQLIARKTLKSFRCLMITHPLSCDTITKIVDICPLLEELSLEIQDGMMMTAITRLTNLKHLEFRNSPTLPSSYLEHVLPILQVKGLHLESLSLDSFDVIDLTTCARLCPNLESLSVQWFTILGYNNTSSTHQKMVKYPFSNLRYVRLRPRSQRNVPEGACALVLSHAKHLMHIEMYCCYDLCDSIVQTLQSKNPMIHLRSLILRHGHNVTKDALNLLVSKAKELTFMDCGTPPAKKGPIGEDDDDGAPDPNADD